MTIENNIIIAEFMGYNVEGDYLTLPDMLESLDLEEEVHFHSSWEWLMPVVEKIEEIPTEDVEGSHKVHRFLVKIEGIVCEITDMKEVKVVVYEDSGDKLSNVYYAVLEFIDWYNENN